MMSGLQPPAVFKDLGRCLTLPACSVSLDRCDQCDLLVDLEGFPLVAAAQREYALVLDIDSCDRCAGYPGCGVNRSRSRAHGGGGHRRALGQGPGKDPVAQYGAGCAANAPARR